MSLMMTTRGFPAKSSTWVIGSPCAEATYVAANKHNKERAILEPNAMGASPCFTRVEPSILVHVANSWDNQHFSKTAQQLSSNRSVLPKVEALQRRSWPPYLSGVRTL